MRPIIIKKNHSKQACILHSGLNLPRFVAIHCHAIIVEIFTTPFSLVIQKASFVVFIGTMYARSCIQVKNV